MTSSPARRFGLPSLAVVAVGALVVSLAPALSPAGAAPAPSSGSDPRTQLRQRLLRAAQQQGIRPRVLGGTLSAARDGGATLPAGVPTSGDYAFLLELDRRSTLAVSRQQAPRGRLAVRAAARTQFDRIKEAQRQVVAQLPARTDVLYRTHAVLAGVAVYTDVHNYPTLRALSGVRAVHPIAPKTAANTYAIKLQRAPEAWANTGHTGENSTIAVIDTGVDYTHKDFGGPGTPGDYDAAKTDDGLRTPPVWDSAKFAGGYDFVGDAYDPDPYLADGSPNPDYHPTRRWDLRPLDCNGHGSHVAGTAAGFGVTTAGDTYAGPYDNSTYPGSFRVGPGMAPGAKLYAYKVFGCQGSTNVVTAAIDRALDPNNDGDTSDHVDVINMSLGSDFASPQDGDSVAANRAAQDGVEVVAASGNGGDFYDIGGSPGNATRVLAVADTVDARDYFDAVHVTAPVGIAGDYRAERSLDYDWIHEADLSGDVVALTDTADSDACAPLSAADSAVVSGKIAFVDWTDNDAIRRCGSARRAANLKAANATGFILHDDRNTFAADIAGSADIPGVMVTKDAGDTISAQLGAGVTVSGTSAAAFQEDTLANNDKLNASSSRGVRGNGNVKPDVGAVGTSVFSTAMGTGAGGVSFTGTSMASPMVAGLAALVHTVHPVWSSEQVKADIMNTADRDVFTGNSHHGHRYAPNRVGAGRIDAEAALENTVLAYVKDNPGAVSVSFGPVAVTGRTSLAKSVEVVNKSGSAATYDLAYRAITSVPGVSYRLSTSTLRIPAHSHRTFTVTFEVTDRTTLTKTHDPTVATSVDLGSGPIATEFLADASGRVLLDPRAAGRPTLRVPVYSAPRPASTMTNSRRLVLPGGDVKSTSLSLSGKTVDQGSGARHIQALMAGFELAAKSPLLPKCGQRRAECVHFADERSADLRYVGATSDAPEVRYFNASPKLVGFTYFAITTHGPWREPWPQQEFDVLIDSNRDGTPDADLFTARFDGMQNIFVTILVNLHTGKLLDAEPVNDRVGNIDSALFDSDSLIMPVSTNALSRLPGARISTRFRYGVVTFAAEQAAVVDHVGVRLDAQHLPVRLSSGALRFDPLHPGVTVYDPKFRSANVTFSLFGFSEFALLRDHATTGMSVRRDSRAYRADRGLGALILHLHNRNGSKAGLVTLKTDSSVTLRLSAGQVSLGQSVSATVRVANTAHRTPTGRVVLCRGGGRVIASGRLRSGKVTFTWRPKARGTVTVYARYFGDAEYTSGRSPQVSYRVV